MKLQKTTANLLMLALAMSWPITIRAQYYSQQKAPLITSWAKSVNPENTHNLYPRPQLQRKSWTNLNGLWDYSITDYKAAYAGKVEGKILVPYPIESALSGVKKQLRPDQLLWYTKNFAKPVGAGRTLLNFGAVDYKATVFINGNEVGEHEGGYTAFRIDVTNYLKAGNNELKVKVWDPSSEGYGPHGKQVLNPANIYYTPSSGIWQTVWLEQVPDSYIDKLTIVPYLDKSEVSITVHSSEVEPVELSLNNVIYKGQANKAIHIKLKNPKLWSPANPYLYRFSARLKSDKVDSYFGMRKISIKKDDKGFDRIALNNKPYFNLGTLDQGFWPDGLYTAPTDDALRFDVEAIKTMGFNTIRKHIKVEPARWYYYCDLLGMLVWQDMVNPNQKLPEGSKAAFETQSREIIDQLYNYPSITTWVLFNERWGAYDQERLTKELKSWDPTRVVNGHTGELLYVDNKLRAPSDNPYVASDMTDVHAYPDPMNSIKQAGKARVVGEFGGIGVPIPGHQWDTNTGWGYIQVKPKDLEKQYGAMVKKLEQFKNEGLSASIYTQPFDVEGEENGLITYDRKVLKIPFDKLRNLHASLNPEIIGKPFNPLNIEQANNTSFERKYKVDLALFDNGKNDTLFLKDLAKRARLERDSIVQEKLIGTYIKALDKPYSKDELLFIGNYTKSLDSKVFNFILENQQDFDKEFGPGTAKNQLNAVFEQSIIRPALNQGNEVDWSKIESSLSRYGVTGSEHLILSKTNYYFERKEWSLFVKCAGEYLNRYPEAIPPFAINNWMWELFEEAADKSVLNEAADLMYGAIQRETGPPAPLIDTYANLLYRSGQKEKAIEWELKAIESAEKYKDLGLKKSLEETAEKMKKNLPTWQ